MIFVTIFVIFLSVRNCTPAPGVGVPLGGGRPRGAVAEHRPDRTVYLEEAVQRRGTGSALQPNRYGCVLRIDILGIGQFAV